MYATVIKTQALFGERFTVVVPTTPTGGTPIIFTRVGSGRGTPWSTPQASFLYPTIMTEKVIGKPYSINVTAHDFAEIASGSKPNSLLQRMMREAVDIAGVTDADAGEPFSQIVEYASTQPSLLVMYDELVTAPKPQPVVVNTAPPAQPIHHWNEPVSMEPEPTPEPEPVVQSNFATVNYDDKTALTVPSISGYIERKFDGIYETVIYQYARDRQLNVLLTGDAGTGKTSSVRHYASINNLPMVTIECTQQTDQSVTQGRFVPTGQGNATRWLYSSMASAIQQPSVILLNELSRMSPKYAGLFLRLLEERELFIEPLNEVIKVHPDCLIVADQNVGFGYTGTSRQDQALLDRFSIKLEFEYDIDIEKNFISSPTLLQFAQSIRSASSSTDEFSVPMSTRILKNFQEQAVNLSFAFAVSSLLSNYPDTDGEREALKMRFDSQAPTIAQELNVPIGSYNK